MLPSQTVSVSIDRPWQAVYDAFWRPEAFARWASGLSQAELHPDGDLWTGHGPEGPVTVRFTPHNDYGVMDHWVDTGAGDPVHIPLRVIANQDGTEVALTLFRQPGMDDAKFAEDAGWVARDLAKLKALAEDIPTK